MAADAMYCEHQRTRGACEDCAHADALADPRRAPATREELHPFPDGGPITTERLLNRDEADEQPPAPPKVRRKS